MRNVILNHRRTKMKKLERKLYPVTVSMADSCLSYAMKRVGIEYNSKDVLNSNWFFQLVQKGIFELTEKPERGTVVVFTFHQPKDPGWCQNSITADGMLITNRTLGIGFHVGVMESQDVMSDYIVPEEGGLIQLRYLKDVLDGTQKKVRYYRMT